MGAGSGGAMGVQTPTVRGLRGDSWSREQGLSSAGQRVRAPPQTLGEGVEGQPWLSTAQSRPLPALRRPPEAAVLSQ